MPMSYQALSKQNSDTDELISAYQQGVATKDQLEELVGDLLDGLGDASEMIDYYSEQLDFLKRENKLLKWEESHTSKRVN